MDIEKIGEELNRVRESDGLEVLSGGTHLNLLRFSNSTFHQTVDTDLIAVAVRSRFGKKTGTAMTLNLNRNSLLETLRESESIARISPEDPYLPPLIESGEHGYDAITSELSRLTPEKKVEIMRDIFNTFKNYKFYGVFFNYEAKTTLFHSTGFNLNTAFNEAQLNLLAVDEKTDNSVWIQRSLRDPSAIDTEEIKKTIEWKLSFEKPETIPPGKYTVILEPVALFDLLMYLPYLAFSGTSHVDGYSPLKGKLGEKVFSSELTLIDDPLDETLFPVKFDAEGVPKKKMVFVENGVFKAIAYDRKTAIKAKTESTGHAGSAFGGIMISHLKMEEGEKTLSELIEETEKGILITRFHYINVVDMQKLVLTGMTRDGTFLIENGKVKKALTNMRFNISLFDAFSDENLIVGKGAQDIGMAEIYDFREPARYRIPPVKIKNFNFIQTGK